MKIKAIVLISILFSSSLMANDLNEIEFNPKNPLPGIDRIMGFLKMEQHKKIEPHQPTEFKLEKPFKIIYEGGTYQNIIVVNSVNYEIKEKEPQETSISVMSDKIKNSNLGLGMIHLDQLNMLNKHYPHEKVVFSIGMENSFDFSHKLLFSNGNLILNNKELIQNILKYQNGKESLSETLCEKVRSQCYGSYPTILVGNYVKETNGKRVISFCLGDGGLFELKFPNFESGMSIQLKGRGLEEFALN